MTKEEITWSLEEVLKKKKITRYKLAKETGLSLPTIYNLEKQKDLNFRTLLLIALYLEVQLSDIITINN